MTTKLRNTQSVTMTVERDVLSQARNAGINLSATFKAALDAELRAYAANRWQKDNREAIDALNHFHDTNGCFSDEFRGF